ncbi:16S rRNA (adenine(1518)-N(6)/adenine(1519)-N(6))-dimethyltransferase RsmA [Halobaculum sp. MBLA0147]|uniref:16S rRNA (adenine(1518)-N(6)/adenine(1519)-N(6))- dimethyltransferase RsmA n=1 Tax=Halobaculum sp. MBLA0147 TaxID=3079934 RepID=UPI0035256859
MTEFRDPDALRRRAGVRGDPGRDQHFLVDDRVLDRLPGFLPAALGVPDDAATVADAATPVADDVTAEAREQHADDLHLLEVGPGTGALTERLLAVADHVTVVEKDPELAAFLDEEFADAVAADRLTVVAGDALDVLDPASDDGPFADAPAFDASVSNLPYGVSSEIAFHLLPLGRPLVLMFQAEFAERMVAEPGTDDYGRLSVSTAHYTDAEIVERVPRTAFDPQPRVDSAVVRCTPREPSYEVPDDAFFLRFVKALFTQRRKTVRNAVRNTAHISGVTEPDAVVAAADEELLSRRPGNLPPATFAELARLAATESEIGPGQ